MAENDNLAIPHVDTSPRRRRFVRIGGFTRFLESTDSLVYALVGASFLIAALFSLCYSIVKFVFTLIDTPTSNLSDVFTGVNTGPALINFVSDLLLTLIIMEVLGTVVHYLRTRATSLKPFLFIGIISATRGVLAVGARLSVADFQQLSTTNATEFRYSMIELAVNAGVIIALGLALRLIGRFLDDEPSQRAPEPLAES
ncbi:MAG TPA: phosphate-starvation-inducible PsiE family protein [Ktedonobacterales bacterium]|nr:phosphate-starvation-inducible PsiE family protein [Ktedonobacterales bacterium]